MQTAGMSPKTSLAVVILAAGEGKRMKSSTPKVLQPLMGKPMLLRLLPTVFSLNPKQVIVVVGHGGDQVREAIANSAYSERVSFVEQTEQLGTGHAVLVTKEAIASDGGQPSSVLVLYGDNPLITAETLGNLVDGQVSCAATVLTVIPADRKGYGRIARSADGSLLKIVEEKDASPDELEITEVNAGSYCFDASLLFENLEKLTPKNVQGEYYLTDVAELLIEQGNKVQPVQAGSEYETMGIDSKDKLATANAYLRDQINLGLMRDGVLMLDPATCWIEPEVRIDADATILPGTMLHGECVIAAAATIGPSVVMRDSRVGPGATVQFAVVRDSTIGPNATVGPFSSLREGSVIGDTGKIGSFVETKKTVIGANSKIPHLSYFGDATLGDNVNIGAGSITCNYDGKRKHKTLIDNDVFVGSDTMLVAPVHLGAGSKTGAGSVVTRDIDAGSLVVGAPAKQLRKPAGTQGE